MEENFSYSEYFIVKDDIIYKFILQKKGNEIIIKNNNYINCLNLEELSILFQDKFYEIDEAYEYIINIFEENNVIIENINKNKNMKIKLIIDNKKKIEINLKYNKNNKDFIISELDEINKLKDENNRIKRELEIIKEYIGLKEYKNPKDLKMKSTLTNDSYCYLNSDNSFTVFKSINDILSLIYSNKDKSIKCYDLNKNKIIKEIKNAHNEYITNFRHYLDKNSKADLILSLSYKDNNIKLWNVNNWQCLVDLQKINKNGNLISACLLIENKGNCIISSNYNFSGSCEPIKIYNYKEIKLKEINNSKESTYFIDNYYDNILSKNFIITGNKGFIRSYDFEDNKLYIKYHDNNDNEAHPCFIIINNSKIIKLIESGFDGNIRIWEFHSGLLLNKIKASDKRLYGLCLWNFKYILVGCEDEKIRVFDIDNKIFIKTLLGHTREVLSLRKIIIPEYGNCLISQAYDIDQIKLWTLSTPNDE